MTKEISLNKLLNFRNLRKSEKIILVTGVFDLLHSAHKKFLKKAKKCGGILLVGLETDERVKKLKGTARPAWKLNKRLKKIAELKCVDFVFALPLQFESEKDHERLISVIKPDILAVSAHTPHQANKRKLVEKYGGELKAVMRRNLQTSTTLMLKNKNWHLTCQSDKLE